MAERAQELWLVRHGETTHSAGRLLAGWADPPLTACGEAEAMALAPLLEGVSFAGVWSSDLRRALTTARLAWGEPRPEPRLREISFGQLEGAFWPDLPAEVDAAILAFSGFQAPGGESVAALEARAREVVASLDGGRHLLFTHGGVVRVLTRHLGLDRFLRTGSLAVVDWPGQRLLRLHEPAG